MKDNLGHEIHIGDYVFCFAGSVKNTIQRIKKARTIQEDWGTREGVTFENGKWLSDYNVVSLNALGVDLSDVDALKSAPGCDALGNSLQVGDKVLYLHPMEMCAEIGIVKKLTAKSCLLSIRKNRFNQEEYRKKYEEIISLTALGKGDMVLDPRRFD